MVDSRHGFTDLDLQLLQFVGPRVQNGEVKLLVLLTKADKLNRSEAARALSIVQLQAGGGQVQMFSALKRQGVEQAAQTLWHWIHPQVPPADPAAKPA
jgi:GTP-binding protein